jgi:excisionase family DNA binding protein
MRTSPRGMRFRQQSTVSPVACIEVHKPAPHSKLGRDAATSGTAAERDEYFPDKLAFTIAEATAVSGIGRTTLYELMRCGDLPARKLGRKTLIPAQALKDLLSQLPTR